MRVLLINSNRRHDFLVAPPIGLCYVATAAKSAGHTVRVLDLCFERRIAFPLRKLLREFRPDAVGVSVRNIDNVNLMHPQSYLSEVAKVVAAVRRFSAAPVILGGSAASLCPAELLKFLHGDFIVVSDGETSFVRLLAALEAGHVPDSLTGVGRFVGGTFLLTSPDHTRFPAIQPKAGRWIDMRPYENMGSSYAVQTKRGCNQQCIYCTYGRRIEGPVVRLRSPADVVDEIEEIVLRHKPKVIEFVDAMFNDPQEHAVRVLEEIVGRAWKAEFTAMGVSARNLNGTFLDLMWRAGFKSFWITPESASETMIRNYRKGFVSGDLVTAAKAIAKTRFTVLWCFLVGGPGETNDTLQETIDFVNKHLKMPRRPPYNMANFFLGVRLYPGTRLWDIAMDEGVVTRDSDPLRPLWYLSKELDLPRAIRQMSDAASAWDGICLGYEEGLQSSLRLIAPLLRLFRYPSPYWRHAWVLNRLFRRLPAPDTLAAAIRLRIQPAP